MKDEAQVFYESPIGLIRITGNTKGVTSLYFVDNEDKIEKPTHNNIPAILQKCIQQIDEYFSGIRREFTIKIALEGTNFQKKVWNELKNITFGKTCSYLDIAKNIGKKNGSRAVGNANGQNPISIIIPCHRVIGSNKKLIGYGGGVWRKKWLLEHEQTVLWNRKFGIKPLKQ
jgi:methylated-DNA-[protein]-cysteine S-methyltransferase